MTEQAQKFGNVSGEQVHCLDCESVFFEPHGQHIEACPDCGNADTQNTVYLQPTEEA